MLTQERLKELLHYDPETGVFTWRCDTRNTRAGARAGSVSKHLGYRLIKFAGPPQLEHRLAFLYMTGAWPKQQVDHINGRKTDNRWFNLRDVSDRVNKENRRKAQANNKVQLLGVSEWPSRGQKRYVAQLSVGGQRVHCSYHATPEEAHATYLEAKRKYHEGNTL